MKKNKEDVESLIKELERHGTILIRTFTEREVKQKKVANSKYFVHVFRDNPKFHQNCETLGKSVSDNLKTALVQLLKFLNKEGTNND